mmetsp:Transcript_14445/g.28900  ORF Transcript_14445/g.28900 Transcript_14445/m.28900 type:complete len:427 (-) Transcript_14445:129-1409(-)
MAVCRSYPGGEALEILREMFYMRYDVSTSDHVKELTLPTACVKECPPAVIHSLLSTHPGCASFPDRRNNLPLHWAACSTDARASETVHLLLNAFPDGVTHRNDRGCLPIHRACACGAQAEVVKILGEEYREGVKKKDGNGNLPLHLVVGNESPSSLKVILVRMLLTEHSEGASTRNRKGELPLHLACRAGKDASAPAIILLLRANPGGPSTVSVKGALALHLACTSGAPVEVVRTLLTMFPASIAQQDGNGHAPLHCAVRYNASAAVVKELLVALREGGQAVAAAPSSTGVIPLHYACIFGSTVDIVRMLVNAHPDGTKKTDPEGNLPVHLAVLSKAPHDVIRFLIAANPESVTIFDGRGRRLSDCLLRNNVHLQDKALVSTLVQAFDKNAPVIKKSKNTECETKGGTTVRKRKVMFSHTTSTGSL